MNERRRRVTSVQHDEDGELVALCNPEKAWSPVYTETVTRHLSIDLFEYYVSEAGYLSYVRAEERDGEKVLVTTPAPDSSNNLENLPEVDAETASAG